MAAGCVYILINPSMPGMIKIGHTSRGSDVRARRLFTTAVPTPFEVAYQVRSDDSKTLEEQMHAELADFKVNDRREFFRYPLKDAINLLLRLGGQLGQPGAVIGDSCVADQSQAGDSGCYYFWPPDLPALINRNALHQQLGGAQDGDVSVSDSSGNVFVFTLHSSWQYCDLAEGWRSDGCYHFMGESMRKDEPLSGANLALLDACKKGYTVRVFAGNSGNVNYWGTFRLDPSQPCYKGDPRDEDGHMMQCVFFRLRPVDAARPDRLFRFFDLGHTG